MRLGLGFLALALSSPAHAFCGLYVGPVGGNLENHSSRVVVALDGDRTTLTMANDVAGDVTDFAMVVPVPEVLGPDQVRLVDRDWIDALDSYTAPRVVSYTCDDFNADSGHDYHHHGGCGGLGCGATADKSGATMDSAVVLSLDGESIDSVKIESEFAIGAYEVVVLSAEESGDLLLWLQGEGYGVPDGGEEVLQEYIDAGVFFFAVKVSLDALPDQAFLEPIQFEYDNGGRDNWSLPTKLGALNSSGLQEVQVFVLNEPASGRARAINAGPVLLENDCMPLLEDGQALDDWYGDWLTTSYGGILPGSIVEYAWPGWEKCDPCSPGFESLDSQMLEALGYPASPVTEGYYEGHEVYLTRLRIRYDAANAVDLQFAPTENEEQTQIRFIDYREVLEDRFPVCGLGLVENPGTCDDEEDTTARVVQHPGRRAAWLGALVLVLGIGMRRRSPASS